MSNPLEVFNGIGLLAIVALWLYTTYLAAKDAPKR